LARPREVPQRMSRQLMVWSAWFLGVTLSGQTSTVQYLDATARQRLAARDANGALEAYEKLARMVPQSAAYQDEVGFLLAATNRTPEAIPYLRRAT